MFLAYENGLYPPANLLVIVHEEMRGGLRYELSGERTCSQMKALSPAGSQNLPPTQVLD
jgi:hypothetical protein